MLRVSVTPGKCFTPTICAVETPSDCFMDITSETKINYILFFLGILNGVTTNMRAFYRLQNKIKKKNEPLKTAPFPLVYIFI